MTEADLDAARRTREVFRVVFDPRRPESSVVLGAILNQAGYFSMNPESVNKDLVALCNWLLYQLGVVHPDNVYNYAKAALDTMNDDDLMRARREVMDA